MVLLDTNVVSKIMKAVPAPEVMAWVDGMPGASLFVSAVSQAEILYGIALLPAGQRRSGLARAAAVTFATYFRGRVLPFDSSAAEAYAALAAARRNAGRPIAQFDAQIAAIARSRGATLATRNVADFEDCGIAVVNPWTARP